MDVVNGYGLAAAIFQSIASLAWPAALFGIVYLFKADLTALLPLIHVKHGDSELGFKRVGEIIQQVQEHDVRVFRQELQDETRKQPSLSTLNLNHLSDDDIRMRVEDIALKMRELEQRFRQERDNEFHFPNTNDWSTRTAHLLNRSNQQRQEWQSTLLPEAVALRDEMIRRIGGRIEVDFQRTDFVFEGMLAGVSPLNEAALTLERLARNMIGDTGGSKPMLVRPPDAD